MVAVSEGYLEHLNTMLSNLTNAIRVNGQGQPEPTPGPAPQSTASQTALRLDRAVAQVQSAGPENEGAVAPLVQDSTTESFIRKFKEVLHDGGSRSDNALATLATAIPTTSSPYSSSCGEGSTTSQRRHANMKFDNIRKL